MKQEIIRIDLHGVNAYLGKSEEGFILFDTGGHLTMDKVFTNRREELIRGLEEAGCKPGNLKAIVLTHGDNDHVANAAFLRDEYHTVIAMHGEDIDLVHDITVEKMLENFRFQSVVFKVISRLINKKVRKLCAKTLSDYEGFRPDIILKEGDNLNDYGFFASIIHLPGHTKGSIGILCKGGDLISGDIFSNMKKPSLALNALDFRQLKSSVNKLKAMNIKKIYPGHGEPFEAGELGW
jgi:hydroxyacylglutathione hydrolase